MKNIKILYFSLPIVVLLLCVFMEFMVDGGVDFNLSPVVLYVIRTMVTLFSLGSMIGVFTLWKHHPIVRVLSLALSMLFVILDYYLNISNPGSDNLLWFMPMLALIYIVIFRSVNVINKIQNR